MFREKFFFSLVVFFGISTASVECSPPRVQRTFNAKAQAAQLKRALFLSPETLKNLTKPSPGQEIIQLTNFHKEIVAALKSERFNPMIKLFYNYFDLIPYNLAIKDKRFYLSLFYNIFRLIARSDPYYYDTSDTLVIFVRAHCDNVYALEFSFTDRAREQVYELSTSEGFKKIPLIRIQCDVDSRQMKIDGVKKPEAAHTFFYDESCVVELKYDQDNDARNILSLLSADRDLAASFQHSLLNLYNTVPQALRMSCEKYYQAIFVLMLTFVRAGSSQWEVVSSIGRSDVVVSSKEIINVVEFKFNKSEKKALSQIEARRYCSPYHGQQRDIRMIGVNVDSSSENVEIGFVAKLYDGPARRPFAWVDELPFVWDSESESEL
jgi:hypothetical protein